MNLLFQSFRLLLSAIAIAALTVLPALCQSSERDLLLDMHNIAKVIKQYHVKKKHMPSQPQELDELLHILYKRSTEYNPNQPLPMPHNSGTYRTLGRFQITFDLSINQESNTLILWRTSPPASWKGRAGNIGIISNGEHKFLLYALDAAGNALKSKDQTIFFVYDLKKGESDERLF